MLNAIDTMAKWHKWRNRFGEFSIADRRAIYISPAWAMHIAGIAESHTDYSVGFNPTFTRSVWIMAESHTD